MTIRQRIFKRARAGVRHPEQPVRPLELTRLQRARSHAAQLKEVRKIQERLEAMELLIQKNKSQWIQGNVRARMRYGELSETVTQLAAVVGALGGALGGGLLSQKSAPRIGMTAGAVSGYFVGKRAGKFVARQVKKLHPHSRDYRLLTKALRKRVVRRRGMEILREEEIRANRQHVADLSRAIKTLRTYNEQLRERLIHGEVRKPMPRDHAQV